MAPDQNAAPNDSSIDPPPVSAAPVSAAPVTAQTVQPTLKDKIGTVVSGIMPRLSGIKTAIDAHHQQQADEADMHQKNWANMLQGHLLVRQGINPQTQQRFDDPNYPGGAEKSRADQNQLDTYYTSNAEKAHENYLKAAGKTKELKQLITNQKAVADHVSGVLTQQTNDRTAAQGQPAAGGLQPPPGSGGSPAAPGTTSSPASGVAAPNVSDKGNPGATGGITPPPKSDNSSGPAAAAAPSPAAPTAKGNPQVPAPPTPPADEPYDPMAAMVRGRMDERAQVFADQARQDKRVIDRLKAEKEYENNLGIDRDRAKAKDASDFAHGGRYSPKMLGSMIPSPGDARGIDDKPLDLDPNAIYTTNDNGKHYQQVADSPRFKTVGNRVLMFSGNTGEFLHDVSDQFGPEKLASMHKTTDPGTGLSTYSFTQPGTAASTDTGAGGGPAPKPSVAGGGRATPMATPTSPSPASPKAGVASTGPRGGSDMADLPKLPAGQTNVYGTQLALDDTNHIPRDLPEKPGRTKQVIEYANQLMDENSLKDIPVHFRGLATDLARQYGWEQGKFTPKEMTPIRLASDFLDRFASSDSLSVLDGGRADRGWLIGALHEADTLPGQLAVSEAARHLNPTQQEFVRNYNQVLGLVGGLSKIARGDKSTEAQVGRLKKELADAVTSASSEDARQRLGRIQDEIKDAMTRGNFDHVGAGTAGAGAASGGKAGSSTKLTPPPKSSGGPAAATAPARVIDLTKLRRP